MKNTEQNSNEKRVCKICLLPLSEDDHGNRKAHRECAYRNKKQRLKERYKIGNTAKLMIQKNEDVAALLYNMDEQKSGISCFVAMEYGFKFNCPTITIKHHKKDIHMFDHYGYIIERINSEDLIFIYHESELQ